MSQLDKAPGRVVVASSELRWQRALRHRPEVRGHGNAAPGMVQALIRAQLRLALTTALLVLAVVGGLPLVFACFPVIARTRLAGTPVPWLVLALCIQPVWIATARWHLRRAERIERDFAEPVAPS